MAITVGIAGFTGKFAKRLVSHLLKRHNVSIRGYCRDPSKAPETISSSAQVTLFEGDAFNKDALTVFAKGCDVIVCCYLGDDKLMVDGQKMLIDVCDECEVPRYIASDWALDYTKLKLGELFPKDPMIHVKAYAGTKKVQGVHILIGGFMKPIFSPFFNIYDPQSQALRFWSSGDEIMEGTTYNNAAEFTAAVAVDQKATGILKCNFFQYPESSVAELPSKNSPLLFEKVYGIKPTLESNGSLDDLYKLMHVKREKIPEDIYSYISLFFYYYWINGQTLLGKDLHNDRYAEVKPVSWANFMTQWPLKALPTSFFALNA
ncbi:nmrA-like family protein [Penicillium malachiteum]|uniref:nmrA-like family protein n=1 Tax=Penicillium malachiteum TaxID=1324776 RepID=UPI002547C60B|nr:nmrA-like family protein [Penicillium malachiteum]KAJ5721451.1 nmrA-like family protein [Penicillium malachiteum]